MSTLAPPMVTAVAQPNPYSGAPEVVISATNAEVFNLVGQIDASFEGSIGTATPVTNCALDDSDDAALDGSFSLAMTALANGAMSARVGPYPVTAGQTYTYTAAYFAAFAPETVSTNVEWYADATFLSTTVGATQEDSNSLPWEPQTDLPTATAPAGATAAYLVFNVAYAAGPIPAPDAPTVTPAGMAGSTTYNYAVTALTPYGETTPSPIGTTTTGNAVLSEANYNALNWDADLISSPYSFGISLGATSADDGATSFNVYRAPALTCQAITDDFATCANVLSSFATCADLLTYVPAPVLIANTDTTSYDDTGAPLSSTTAPTENTSAERHYVDEVGLFPGTVAAWTIFQTGVITIERTDGTYVLGASPLFPLTIPATSPVVSIVDYTAPYGLPVSYIATLVTDVSDISPPSVPSAPVLMGQAPDTLALYNRMGWAKDKDVAANEGMAYAASEQQVLALQAALDQAVLDSAAIATSAELTAVQTALNEAIQAAATLGPYGVLLQWLSGIGQMIQGLDNLFFDQIDNDGNYYPGPSQLLDINRCPTDMLPWLGQFVGVSVDPTLRDDQQRYSILQESGFGRGTPSAILAAANKFVHAGGTATLTERDAGAYHLTVTIPTAGTTTTGSCRSIALAYATCADLAAAFETCADVWQSTAAATAAVLAAVPAGLGCTVAYD